MASPVAPAPCISLPPAFAPREIHVYVAACIEFLTSPLVSSLLESHPNDVAVHGPRPHWDAWWRWAAAGTARWTLLVPGWTADSSHKIADLPGELRQLLDTIDRLTLPRTPNRNLIPEHRVPLRGMSPKKAHEVSQMTSFIQAMLSQTHTGIRHLVDVGAGQGYLSRALSTPPLSTNVLALDFSEVQTKGAQRRASNIQKKSAKKSFLDSPGDIHTHCCNLPSPTTGSLTHEMIAITPQTLHASVSRWISAQSLPHATPVMFVALHACGTLTPDILRCFLANQDRPHPPRDIQPWHAAALVVVGCCYNLMSPDSDFPMSYLVSNELKTQEHKLRLSYNHRSLAAQSPLQWSLNDTTKAAAELALRKIVYRALFAKLASSPFSTSPPLIKIGRLHDSAYTSLQEFISSASKKSGIHPQIPPPSSREDSSELELELTSRLQVLHTLRSRIGPVIESLIIVDRYLYLTENAPNSHVFALNLFEQDLGSGRNSALIVLPREILPS